MYAMEYSLTQVNIGIRRIQIHVIRRFTRVSKSVAEKKSILTSKLQVISLQCSARLIDLNEKNNQKQ